MSSEGMLVQYNPLLTVKDSTSKTKSPSLLHSQFLSVASSYSCIQLESVFLKIDNNNGLLKQLEKVFTNDFFKTLNFLGVRFAIYKIKFWHYFIAFFFIARLLTNCICFSFNCFNGFKFNCKILGTKWF